MNKQLKNIEDKIISILIELEEEGIIIKEIELPLKNSVEYIHASERVVSKNGKYFYESIETSQKILLTICKETKYINFYV